MLEEIKTPENVPKFVADVKAKKAPVWLGVLLGLGGPRGWCVEATSLFFKDHFVYTALATWIFTTCGLQLK